MKFRTGVIIGFAAGYVMGAKAGNERYFQIESLFSSVADNAFVQGVMAKSRDAAGVAGDAARTAASNGFHEASRRVREAVEGG